MTSDLTYRSCKKIPANVYKTLAGIFMVKKIEREKCMCYSFSRDSKDT